MESKGILTLVGYSFPITRATFRCVGDAIIEPPDEAEMPRWDFDVFTGPPINPSSDEVLEFLFGRGIRFYTEGDRIPLADAEDMTGAELYLKDSCDPQSGEVYFTVYLGEHNDVSDLTLQFLERKGSSYRMMVSALVHSVFEEPTRFEIDTWIEKLPSD
jgi:hypothetical protein